MAVVGNAFYDELKGANGTGSLAGSIVVLAFTTLLFMGVVYSLASLPVVQQAERPFRRVRFFNSILGALVVGVFMAVTVGLLWTELLRERWMSSAFLPSFTNQEVGMISTMALLIFLFVRKQTDWVALCVFAASGAVSLALVVKLRVDTSVWTESEAATSTTSGYIHVFDLTVSGYLTAFFVLTAFSLLLIALGVPKIAARALAQR